MTDTVLIATDRSDRTVSIANDGSFEIQLSAPESKFYQPFFVFGDSVIFVDSLIITPKETQWVYAFFTVKIKQFPWNGGFNYYEAPVNPLQKDKNPAPVLYFYLDRDAIMTKTGESDTIHFKKGWNKMVGYETDVIKTAFETRLTIDLYSEEWIWKPFLF